MKLTEETVINICEPHRKLDETMHNHCKDCPLITDEGRELCLANSHINVELNRWVSDFEE